MVLTLGSFYSNTGKKPSLRLGWGTGLLGMTVCGLLDNSLLQRLRNEVFVDRQGAPVPKSKRVCVNGNKAINPLGWIRIS